MTEDQQIIDKFLTELTEEVATTYGDHIDFIILFGSAARGEFKIGVSDIDLVIQLKSGGNRKAIEDYSTDIFWDLDEKYQTQFKRVLSTAEPKNFGEKLLKKLEKSTHLYVPIFVIPPGWLDWQRGRIQKPSWKPVAFLLITQVIIFEKFKYEGKILYGRDIRPLIKPKITFWERWKALQIPFYISLFAVIISPLFLKNSLKYATKAILWQLDSILVFLNIRLNEKGEKIQRLENEAKSQIEINTFGFYLKSSISLISKKELDLFEKAIKIKTKVLELTHKESRKFVFQAFWFILRVNWSILIKRYITLKNLLKVLIFFLVLVVIAYFSITYYALYKLTHPKPKPLEFNPNQISQEYEDVNFPSRFDNLNIEGWFFKSGQSDEAIILVSGSDQNRIDPGYGSDLVAKDLLSYGFNVLLFDFRGRGNSDYAIYSIGAFEKYDLAGAYDFLKEKGFADKKIGIVSISLGAGTSILALPLIPEVGAIVLDSSYSDINKLVERELPGRSGLPKIFSWGINFWARIVYDIKFNEMIPEKILKNYPDKELLLIHGNNDKYIPLEDSVELQRSSPKSDLWVVAEAGHVKAYKTKPQEYIKRITDYFNEVLE